MKCCQCGKGRAKEHPVTGEILCKVCWMPCITLAEATGRFLLRDEEVVKLRYGTTNVGRGRWRYEFLLSEVEELAKTLPEDERLRRERRRASGIKAAETRRRNEEAEREIAMQEEKATFERRLETALANAPTTLPSSEEVNTLIERDLNTQFKGLLGQVIGYLRHRYTDYDQLRRSWAAEGRYSEIKRRFTEVIRDKYPSLAPTCSRQIKTLLARQAWGNRNRAQWEAKGT